MKLEIDNVVTGRLARLALERGQRQIIAFGEIDIVKDGWKGFVTPIDFFIS